MSRREEDRLDQLWDTLLEKEWEPGVVAGWDADTTSRNYLILMGSGFYDKTLPLACVAVELLAARQPDTVRGVMYAVVSEGWLPDTSDRSYARVQRILNILRKKRILPFEWIVDNVRTTLKPSSWSGLADFADSARDAYRMDFWASLPEYVAIICEKDTVAGRLQPVTEEYDVPLHPLRGFVSTTFAWEVSRNFEEIKKPIHIYYVGDHDPSGYAIEQNIVTAALDYGGQDFYWTRLAVLPEHFERFRIKPLRPKKKDTRTKRFVDRFGWQCAEVEAIPADALRDMVKQAIHEHIPAEEWDRLMTIEKAEKERCRDVMRQLGAVA